MKVSAIFTVHEANDDRRMRNMLFVLTPKEGPKNWKHLNWGRLIELLRESPRVDGALLERIARCLPAGNNKWINQLGTLILYHPKSTQTASDALVRFEGGAGRPGPKEYDSDFALDLARNGETMTLVSLVRSPIWDPPVIEAIMERDDRNSLIAIAEDHRTSDEHLRRLSSSTYDGVRRAVAKHPNVTMTMLKVLLRDESQRVRDTAREHLRLKNL
ncbi:MAG: hypothetical protein NUV56_04725 [Candidatus Uhrbacteria bacterium]|nr:hypothetical protein [Candidatus Uhrbacteria bacterium]